MWSDLLIFPIILVVAISLKAILQGIGITNHLIYLCCLFLMVHLAFTMLMRIQLGGLQDTYMTKTELSAFSAIVTAIIALGTYVVIGLFPILKAPFFLFRYLPLSQYWYDLFIVSVPTIVSHVASRLVVQGQLE